MTLWKKVSLPDGRNIRIFSVRILFYFSVEFQSKSSRKPVSAVHVSFGQKKFQTMRRSERFGFIDFISNCGGLMGLFMGISVMSFVELIHYLNRLFAKGPKTVLELTCFSLTATYKMLGNWELKGVNSEMVLCPFANNQLNFFYLIHLYMNFYHNRIYFLN